MQIGTRLTSSYRKNRESNFLEDAKGSILPMERISSKSPSRGDTGKSDSTVSPSKKFQGKGFRPTSNPGNTNLLSEGQSSSESMSRIDPLRIAPLNADRNKKPEGIVSEEQLLRQDDDLAELTTKFLETNTVYTSVSASLARFENHSNSQQGNPDQNSDIRKYLDDLQKIQSHLETIKSENLELEGFEEYQKLADKIQNKIQDKIRYQNYQWLMNTEINHLQLYPNIQAIVKELREIKENWTKYHDKIHIPLLEATKPHNQTLLKLKELIQLYEKDATRYGELSQDLQRFIDYMPQLLKDDLQQKSQDFQHFESFQRFFKHYERRMEQTDHILAQRCKRFINHHKRFISPEDQKIYKELLGRRSPGNTIDIQKIRDFQTRIAIEDRILFEKLQEKIIPEKRIKIEYLQDPEFSIDNSNRIKWLDEIKPKLDATEMQQLNLLQGKLHPVHHLNNGKIRQFQEFQDIQRIQRIQARRRRDRFINRASLVIGGTVTATAYTAIAVFGLGV
jgi:hypothetical protein